MLKPETTCLERKAALFLPFELENREKAVSLSCKSDDRLLTNLLPLIFPILPYYSVDNNWLDGMF